MPRNLSFMLTKAQVEARTKTVTRRNGWLFLKSGDLLWAVEKSQGLGKGGKIKRICQIEVVDVRREQLCALTDDVDYGFEECRREGFPQPHPNGWPSKFVEFFCGSHRGVTPQSKITRIEFRYFDQCPAALDGDDGTARGCISKGHCGCDTKARLDFSAKEIPFE